MMITKKLKHLAFFVVITISGLGAISLIPSTVNALSGSEFKAGRIIDDGVFFNPNTMSPQEIQQFLNSKVPTCDTNGSQIYSGSTTRAQYGASKGNPAPYTCLKSYSESTVSRAAEAQLCNAYTGGTKSSSQIIYDVAQACGVSPKVLLVLLQKEQALVTDDWPWPIQYRSATGFGCPDTAPCDAEYYGFFNQVYNAARIYKRYAKNADQYNYLAYRNNNVLLNPNSSCGSSSVYLENQATTGLYIYTPYQPNAAALNNLYGSGDGCSAYGNRNFWRLFIDWFGSVNAAPYVSNYSGQAPNSTISPGTSAPSYFMYQNRGSSFWYDDTSLSSAPGGTFPVHLATSNAVNRCSDFSAEWTQCNRPAKNFSAVYESDGLTLAGNQHVARPGQIVKFSFSLNVPAGYSAGSYNEYFIPVLEGSTNQFFNDQGTFATVAVSPVKTIAWHAQSSYPTIAPTDKSSAYIQFKNTGNTALFDDSSIVNAPAGNYPTHLATSCPLNSNSVFASSWPSPNRPAVRFSTVYKADGSTLAENQHVALPGQIIRFNYDLQTPKQFAAGTNRVCVRPVLEGTPDGTYVDQGIYTDVTVPAMPVVGYIAAPAPQISSVSGEQNILAYTMVNHGNTTLASGSTLVTMNGSAFQDSTWKDGSAVTNITSPLAPGESLSIQIPLLAPSSNSDSAYTFNFGLNDQSGNPVQNSTFYTTIKVAKPRYAASYYNQSRGPVFTYGQTRNVFYSYKNLGNKPWYDDMSLSTATKTRVPQPTHLATAGPINRPSGFVSNWPSVNRPAVLFTSVYEADGVTLAENQHVVQPGQVAKYSFDVTPASWVNPGIYKEYVQPIIEGTPDGAINTQGTYLDYALSTPTYTAAFYSQSSYPSLTTGQAKTVYLKYKNTGNATWYDDSSFNSAPANSRLYRTHLATSRSLNRASEFSADWPTPSRPAVLFTSVYEIDGVTLANDQHAVQPGQIAQYGFNVTKPSGQSSGTYREFFQPIAENSIYGGFNDPYTFLDIYSQ